MTRKIATEARRGKAQRARSRKLGTPRAEQRAPKPAPAVDAAPSYGNGHAEFLKQLWQAAVELRGSIEPADYKRYVLPIIFLRFLSLRYEQRRAELEAMIRDPESEYHTTNAKVAASILNDADEYRRAGAFVIPPKARWDFLLKNAQADDIKTILDDALNALEDAYPDKLRGLLPRVFAGSNLSRENLTGLINLFSKDVFRHDGSDLIGRVYEYFIGGFADSEGKRGGEYFTPVSIVRVLVSMLEPTEGAVFDPCCGSGGMFVQSDIFTKHSHKLSFHGQESKDFTYRLCRMNLSSTASTATSSSATRTSKTSTPTCAPTMCWRILRSTTVPRARTAGARTACPTRTHGWSSAPSACRCRRATPTRCGSCTSCII